MERVTKRIYVALPCYKGEVSILTLTSLLQAKVDCAKEGWSLTLDPLMGSGDLPHIRNIYLSRFLSENFTDLLFWDSDIGCSAGDFLKIFRHPVDFVCGAYPQKKEPISFPLRTEGQKRPRATSELISLEGAPAGFMRLTRSAVEYMVSAYLDRCYEDVSDTRETFKAYSLFDVIFTPGKDGLPGTRLSEDLSFCARWRALGKEIFVDPRLNLFHQGNKVYQGSLKSFLERLEAIEASK